ncbi:MAG TPA: glucokinase [Rhizomicrobium sp.]|nr:glucokinase [Rhizomicrobium sp.]
MSGTVLVGDVGGTHARFAVAARAGDSGFALTERADLNTDDFPTLAAAVRAYLGRLAAAPGAIVLAVAGPVTAGAVKFTNHAWNTSEAELRTAGFRSAMLINDFAALAFAIASLGEKSFRTIGPEHPGLAGETITVLGAGTGFGVSCLARYRGRAVPLATEGGHMGFAPGTGDEVELVRTLRRRFDHVSVERVLSGPGLENIHTGLAELRGMTATHLPAEKIVAAAQAGDVACRASLDMFCGIFGSVAGDFALAHGARGGVFIGGGIAAKIEDYLETSAFRARFEAKGRMSYFVQPIPTRLVANPDAAFLGAARAAQDYGLLDA